MRRSDGACPGRGAAHRYASAVAVEDAELRGVLVGLRSPGDRFTTGQATDGVEPIERLRATARIEYPAGVK